MVVKRDNSGSALETQQQTEQYSRRRDQEPISLGSIPEVVHWHSFRIVRAVLDVRATWLQAICCELPAGSPRPVLLGRRHERHWATFRVGPFNRGREFGCGDDRHPCNRLLRQLQEVARALSALTSRALVRRCGGDFEKLELSPNQRTYCAFLLFTACFLPL